MAALSGVDAPQEDELIPAPSVKKQFFFRALETVLSEGGFFSSPEMQPGVMRNIMAMYNRAGLTEQDLKTLHGMLKAIKRSNP